MATMSARETDQKLQELLSKSLAVVESRQRYKARNRVTNVCVADIDDDGDPEIIFGSADGRLAVLSKECELRWSRIVGDKSPVTALAVHSQREGIHTSFFIVVGLESGFLYVYDKDGKVRNFHRDVPVLPDYAFNSDLSGGENNPSPYLFKCAQTINQICITPDAAANIIFTSEDRHVYALDHRSGEELWQPPFPADGWARYVFACDLDNDGATEILVSTANGYLYLLDHNGCKKNVLQMKYPIRALCAADINHDGMTEILVATDKRDLIVLKPNFEQIWSYASFTNRLHALSVVDINKDGTCQIIAGGDDKNLYILDAEGKMLWRHFLGARIASLCASDIDGDGVQEIIVGANDYRVHTLRVNLIKAKDDLYQQMRKVCQKFAANPQELPTWLIPSERELLRNMTFRGQEEPVYLKQAEALLSQGRFQEALTAFLLLEHQKIQPLWRKETGYETRILCFGSVLGDLIIGTTDGKLRAYDARGKDLWSRSLPDQILAAQVGRIQGAGSEDILVCSSDHQIYLIGCVPGKDRKKRTMQPEVLKSYPVDDALICSIVFKTEYKNLEVILGSENNKIYIYRHGLEQSPEQIPTSQGVRIIQFYPSKKKHKDAPDIIAARTDQYVAAYKYSDKEELWKYKVWKRVRSLTVSDIDGDNHDEIVIGSEDRNIHVINDQGHLKWRYYLPYSVLSTHVLDINQDGALEILAGCSDGYLYIFSAEGDLLWNYAVGERITTIASRQREDEHTVEIALGTESRVELLQVIDPGYLQNNIATCWRALTQEKSEAQVVGELLQNNIAPALRAFVLQKAACLFSRDIVPLDVEYFAPFLKDSSVRVRKALVYALSNGYHLNPGVASLLLEKLSRDQNPEVKLALIEHIGILMEYDWITGFEYLIRFSDNVDRLIRRGVIRRLYGLIDERRDDSWTQIFKLLLKGAQDKSSIWVCQEAARSLAHFLDHQPWELLYAIYNFIIKGVKENILLHMAHYATVPTVCETLEALVQLQKEDLNAENALTRLSMAVQALHRIQDSKFGAETWLVMNELHELFNMQTLEEIALYQCQLKTHQPDPNNQHFGVARRIFESIPTFTRLLKIYLQRQNVNDRIASLQEANRALERLHHFMDNEYQVLFEGEPLKKLPDYRFFCLLFKQWREMLQKILQDLRGRPKLNTDFLTREVCYEKLVTVLLNVQNTGRSPAYSVRVELLHSEDFTVTLPTVSHMDVLFWQETLRAEFTIKLKAYKENVDLNFEITYDDGESELCKEIHAERLVLQLMEARDYEFIPNPYSTGTPVNSNEMFFGREFDVDLLRRELALNAAQRVIVLHGLRRSGKTSLLLHLVNNDVLDNCVTTYIDMQNIIHEMTVGSFFFNIAYQMQRSILRKKQMSLPLPAKAVFQDEPTFTFDRFLDEIETYLPEQRLVLLIDEFEILQEQTEQGQLSPTLFRYLRSLMQARKINFLLAGTHRLEQLTKDYWAVFYSFALPHRLSKISEEGALHLVAMPVKERLTYDPFAIEKIRQLAGDQPFLLNSLCRILVDHCNQLRKTYITLYDVNALLSHAVTVNSTQFSGLWQQVSLEEQYVLAIIAQASHERPFTYAEIENISDTERIPCGHQQLRDALGSLAQQNLLESILEEESEQMRYRIPIGLLRIWINQERSLAMLMQHKKGRYR